METPSPARCAPRALVFVAWMALVPACGGAMATQSSAPSGAPTEVNAPSPNGPGVAAAAETARVEAAGEWTGDDWGSVVIAPDGSGSYTDTFGTGPGRLHLRRAGERLYAGVWGESSQRFGTIELLLSSDGRTLSGAWAPDPRSTIGSRTGGPVAWTRHR